MCLIIINGQNNGNFNYISKRHNKTFEFNNERLKIRIKLFVANNTDNSCYSLGKLIGQTTKSFNKITHFAKIVNKHIA